MNKELDVLERIKTHFKDNCVNDWEYSKEFHYEEDLSTIEKSLKALEIIKKKEVDVHILLTLIHYHKENALTEYNKYIINDYCDLFILTQEEYNLLKEVLL